MTDHTFGIVASKELRCLRCRGWQWDTNTYDTFGTCGRCNEVLHEGGLTQTVSVSSKLSRIIGEETIAEEEIKTGSLPINDYCFGVKVNYRDSGILGMVSLFEGIGNEDGASIYTKEYTGPKKEDWNTKIISHFTVAMKTLDVEVENCFDVEMILRKDFFSIRRYNSSTDEYFTLSFGKGDVARFEINGVRFEVEVL